MFLSRLCRPTAIFSQQGLRQQHFSAFAINILSYYQGFSLTWSSSCLLILASENSPAGVLTTEEISWIGAMFALGGFCLSPIYGYMTTHRSRKETGYIMGIICLISWTLTLFAKSFCVLCAGRFLAASGSLMLCPTYVGEIAHKDIRGRLSMYYFILYNLGILSSLMLGTYTSYEALSLVGIIVCITFMFVFYWAPESPVFLMKSGKFEEAKECLKRLRGNNEKKIEEEMESISVYIEQFNNKISISTDFIKDIHLRKAILICIIVTLNYSVSGTFIITSYLGNILKEFPKVLPPYLVLLFPSICQVLGSLCTYLLIDKLGRKALLVTSNLLVFITLLCLGIYFSLLYGDFDVSRYFWVPLSSLFIYFYSVPLGIFSVPFILMNELIPIHAKTFVVTTCICILWITCFIVAKYFFLIVDTVGLQVLFYFFALCCLLCAVFASLCIPETKRTSLPSGVNLRN